MFVKLEGVPQPKCESARVDHAIDRFQSEASADCHQRFPWRSGLPSRVQTRSQILRLRGRASNRIVLMQRHSPGISHGEGNDGSSAGDGYAAGAARLNGSVLRRVIMALIEGIYEITIDNSLKRVKTIFREFANLGN